MATATKPNATLDIYLLDKKANLWTWQIETGGEAITPQRGRTFQTAKAARKAALSAAAKLNLHITRESNLEER